ncbi:toprim domain-containing protein [Cellvibrio sp. QJXJ]|uniref:toprim domain-containing protein n=1 Tax=Cellvibrio sp. QJXJ TaxID=2964606 RepID=UPI0021C2964E|nr:toprim domain-containing protein [Cellvibrio sp. QJXJ]UUA73069.1 hypothetical protein NNX04_01150 [Cellvibrio sp. QJXJ]
MNLEQQIVEALLNDAQLAFTKTSSSKKLWGGTCPDCKKKEVFISLEKPYQLKCNRLDNCGYQQSTRERYSHLLENLSEKYPVTESDPNATAKAYMSMVRGFPLIKTESWFEQGVVILPNGRYAPTVRFLLWDGFWWDRLINKDDVRDNVRNGGKPRKAMFKKDINYTGKHWTPPGQIIEKGDHVYVVEGIFHAIALYLSGYKVVAAFSCSNLPREFITAHKEQNITWCLAYDAGNGGENYSLKYLKEINGMKEAARICLPHSENMDWDDLYRAGMLDDKYLEDSKWRGRLLAAETYREKAFILYCWRPYHHTLITFKRQTYAVSVSTSDLTKALEGDAIDYATHKNLFELNSKVDLVLNCEVNSLHSEVDKFTKEIKYIFNAKTESNRNGQIIEFSASSIADKNSFSLSLLGKISYREFTGSAGDFKLLKQRWSKTSHKTIETIPFIGYDETARAYVFPQAGYKDGKCVKVNDHGYLDFKDFGIKTTLQNVKFIHSEHFDVNILPDFIKIFDMNGMAALAYWTATLFTRQIKERHKSFPFLEVTGDPEAGKSTLMNFLWKLFGRDNYEGVDLLTTSSSSEGRMLSQLSNLPLVALESDRETDLKAKGGRPSKQVDWDSFKKIYDLDGVLMSRGVKTNDNQVNESIFRGALVITQNASVQASQAIMTRINHLHCTTAHKKIENRPIADRLKVMPVEELAGYLHMVLCKEPEWLQVFFAAFENHRYTLTKTTSIKSQRIIDNHAQHMAAAEALKVVFPNLTKETLQQVCKHLVLRAQERERRLKADHPLVQQFWEAYHYINDQKMTLIDEDRNETEVDDEKLNHSINPKHIAVNLNEFIEHARLRGQGFFDIEDLKKVLTTSRHYPFVDQKPVNSRKTKGNKRCFVFLKPVTD